MGELIPIGHTEVLPGDSVQHHTNVLVRVSPLAAPIMHNITARVHHFFVPYRLCWGERFGDPGTFEDFITGGSDGNDTQTVPQRAIEPENWDVHRLYDYFGIQKPTITTNVSVLPFRAYGLIFDEYYRDQDMLPPVAEQPSAYVRECAWEKDYFSSARPWTQKGPDVTLPVGSEAPVRTTNAPNITPSSSSTDAQRNAYFGTPPEEDQRLIADLSDAQAINVNDFRKAFALQRYQEARARYGSRYTEFLRYLGVRASDQRLQRPEFLGGGTAQLQISEILQTAPENNAGGPTTEFGVGDMYGHGVGAMRSNKYRRHIEEHGMIITLLSVRPKTIYANACDRTFLRQDKEDFWQKELEHIGQQQIWEGELYLDGDDTKYNTWAYQDRYAEYRQNFSKVTGEFRNLLNYWHMARDFESPPTLNYGFVRCQPTKRIHNEQTKHALWIAAQHKMVARRLVSRSAMPRIY